jgi:hypothetical protein
LRLGDYCPREVDAMDRHSSRLAEPMREYCANLTEVVIQPGRGERGIREWLAVELPDFRAS